MLRIVTKNPIKIKHRKTIPISSKDRRHTAQFIRRARRKKGRPISRRTKHESNNKQIREKIYEAISESKEPLTHEEIADKTKLPSDSINYGVRALKNKKVIKTLPNFQDFRSVLYTTSSRKPIVPIKKNE
jgi:predicted HTH transcriptional regulator